MFLRLSFLIVAVLLRRPWRTIMCHNGLSFTIIKANSRTMDVFSTVRSRSIKLNSSNKSSTLSRSNTAEYGSLSWTFDPNNHFLSEKLTRWVYNKWVLRIQAIIGVLLILILLSGQFKILFVSFVIFCVVLFIPWDVMIILSFNRDAFGFIIRSSEFWIKVIYAVIHQTLEIIHYHQVGRKTSLSDVPELFGYSANVCMLLTNTMFMIIIGGTDAIPRLRYKWKATLSALSGFFWTVLAIGYHFGKEKDDYIIRVQATESVISFHSLRANTSGMLAMFIWKQVIDVMRNRNRCISINYKPYLYWKLPTHRSEVTNSVIPDSSEVAIETTD